jgi:hypothetical protein
MMLTFAQSKKIDDHPLSGLAFEQDCIITSCLEGASCLLLIAHCCDSSAVSCCGAKMWTKIWEQDICGRGIDHGREPTAVKSTCQRSLGRERYVMAS